MNLSHVFFIGNPPRRDNIADPILDAVADVISEVSAFAQSFTGQGRSPRNNTGGNHVYQERTVVDDNDAVDQQLLEEAVRQSLESSASSSASASASATATDSTTATTTGDSTHPATTTMDQDQRQALDAHIARQQQAYASHMAYTYGTAGMGMGGVQSYPQASAKPMCRFVKDVTFPDGTQVQPGSVFLKTWRIRNDGAYTWPDQVALVYHRSYFILPLNYIIVHDHIHSSTLSYTLALPFVHACSPSRTLLRYPLINTLHPLTPNLIPSNIY